MNKITPKSTLHSGRNNILFLPNPAYFSFGLLGKLIESPAGWGLFVADARFKRLPALSLPGRPSVRWLIAIRSNAHQTHKTY